MTHPICNTAAARVRTTPNRQVAAAPHQPRTSLTSGAIAKARSVILLCSGAAELAVPKQLLSIAWNPNRRPLAPPLAARPDTIIPQGPA